MIKLLIVDDSALMRKLLTGIFTEEGDFDIRTARNGAEALELARTGRPDVVTLDINMPEMDGLTCLSRLMVETPCPVVIVSSLSHEGAEITLEALHLGAVDVVAKPEGTVSLSIDRIRPLLVEKVRAAAQARLRPTLRLVDRVRHRIGRTGGETALPVSPRRPPRVPIPVPAAPPATAPPATAPPDGPAPEGLVLIGASTGGPPALEAILADLPGDFPWPVLVAQHMPATFTGVFAQRLDRLCALTVLEAIQAMPIRPGHVYIARGDADLIVAHRPTGLIVQPVPASPSHRRHPSVDRLVISALNQSDASRLIGVLITGMGNDGAAAMARLHGQGGYTIAQDENSAVVWGMPGELVRQGGADSILPLTQIATDLQRKVRTPCR
jgi:two-component system, chemotaxis family, protein-glutamate methylesterase/glutaminase